MAWSVTAHAVETYRDGTAYSGSTRTISVLSAIHAAQSVTGRRRQCHGHGKQDHSANRAYLRPELILKFQLAIGYELLYATLTASKATSHRRLGRVFLCVVPDVVAFASVDDILAPKQLGCRATDVAALGRIALQPEMYSPRTLVNTHCIQDAQPLWHVLQLWQGVVSAHSCAICMWPMHLHGPHQGHQANAPLHLNRPHLDFLSEFPQPFLSACPATGEASFCGVLLWIVFDVLPFPDVDVFFPCPHLQQ
jgi:hypothetical protein